MCIYLGFETRDNDVDTNKHKSVYRTDLFIYLSTFILLQPSTVT